MDDTFLKETSFSRDRSCSPAVLAEGDAIRKRTDSKEIKSSLFRRTSGSMNNVSFDREISTPLLEL